jgi:hypothetical protein
VTGVFIVGLNDKNATERDFIQYWASGKQLIRAANPYDPVAILQLERSAGLEGFHPKVTYSPPVALFLVWPLGLVSAKTGLILWLLTLIGCLSVSVWILWLLNGRPSSRLHLFGYVFAPALACLMAGQLGIFMLLGLVLFFYLYRLRPFLAGAALLPCALKPHLFLPFALVLLLWVVRRKTYRILAGFFANLAASCALSLYLDSHVWQQYSETMRTTGVLQAWVPTLSVSLRFLVDRDAVWLQLVPEAGVCVWAIWYYWVRRDSWSWMREGLILLLVSTMCTPYAWFTDETILLPAVLAGIYRAADSRRLLVFFGLIAGVSLIEVLRSVPLTSPYYLWTTPAWLAWYLIATKSEDTCAKEFGPSEATAENLLSR